MDAYIYLIINPGNTSYCNSNKYFLKSVAWNDWLKKIFTAQTNLDGCLVLCEGVDGRVGGQVLCTLRGPDVEEIVISTAG